MKVNFPFLFIKCSIFQQKETNKHFSLYSQIFKVPIYEFHLKVKLLFIEIYHTHTNTHNSLLLLFLTFLLVKKEKSVY